LPSETLRTSYKMNYFTTTTTTTTTTNIIIIIVHILAKPTDEVQT